MSDYHYQSGYGHGQPAQPDPRRVQNRPFPRYQDPSMTPQHSQRYPQQERHYDYSNVDQAMAPQGRRMLQRDRSMAQQTTRLAPPYQQDSQWPLVSDFDSEITQPVQQQRRPPPQRPPRPTRDPVVLPVPQQRNAHGRNGPPDGIPQYSAPLSPDRMQAPHLSPGVWSEGGYAPSPVKSFARPLTGGSYVSVSSSHSRPEDAHLMPVHPPAAAQARARPPLGPPPSARRGPSSYYPQQQGMAFVAPIVEESDSQRGSIRGKAGSHSSYASSNAIPIGVPDHYLTEFGSRPALHTRTYTDSECDSSTEHLPMQPAPAMMARPGLDSPPALVRQASLGKRSKPTLTTIKSGENFKSSQLRHEAYGYDNDTSTHYRDSEHAQRRVSSGVFGKENLEDRYSSDSDRSFSLDIMRSKEYGFDTVLETLRPNVHEDGVNRSVRDRLDAEKARQVHDVSPLEEESSLAKRVGARRPPRLNVDAIKEAKQRGSLTSLTDLIRRATKVASNLDRGRTASKLGFAWMEDEKQDRSAAVAAANAAENRRSGSLSDMLSSFPPPALATPGSTGRFRWPSPSHLRHSALPSASDDGERSNSKKRVCGMRRCSFCLLMLLLLVLIAAAVLVPVFLLVIVPRWNSPQSQLAACQKSTTCFNGGINLVGTGGGCECLCVNGFSGATCEIQPSSRCTTTTINGNDNVTLGNALPRLLSAAETSYSVPLDGQKILSLFSSSNLSCSSQNNLVTFSGQAKRNVQPDSESRIPSRTVQPRQQSATTSSDATETSNGIVFQTGSSPASSSSSSGSIAVDNTTQTLDFARVAVLYILQDSGQLNDAVFAQQVLQSYFSTGADSSGNTLDASNVTLQNGYSTDLVQYHLVIQNGTVVG